jgi:hypothetical protein
VLGLVDDGPDLAWAERRMAQHQLAGHQFVGRAEQPEGVGVRQNLVN